MRGMMVVNSGMRIAKSLLHENTEWITEVLLIWEIQMISDVYIMIITDGIIIDTEEIL